MKFEELPGIPGIWLDFLRSRIPILSAPSSVKSLVAHADAVVGRRTKNNDLVRALAGQEPDSSRVLEHIQRLGQPHSVAVVTEIHSGLFGGPVVHIIKCLTAIKLCEELVKEGVSAIPICWINSDSPADFSNWSVSLLDADGEIHSMEISPGETIPDHISDLISQIGKFGGGDFDTEVLEILQSAFRPGGSLSAASARLISALTRQWGMIVFDPGAPEFRPIISRAVATLQARNSEIQFLMQGTASTLAGLGYGSFSTTAIPASLIQSLLFPVLVHVTDPFEIRSLANVLPVFEEIGRAQPIVWPEASATVGDVRCCRTLRRYSLSLAQLYSGEEEVLRTLREALPRAAAGKLRSIKSEVETRISELKRLVSEEGGFSKTADSCKEKILYQIDRLEHLLESALNTKEHTASRHIHQACNFLAPHRRLQERELAAVQIPLRYASEGLRHLYEKLDILSFEHQLIWMD